MKRQQPREDVAGSRMMNPFPCACATPGRQHLAATGIPSNWFVRGEGSQCPPFVRSFVSFLRKAETRLDGSSSSSSPPAPHNFTSISRMLLHHEQQRQPSVSHSSMHETFPSVALPNSSLSYHLPNRNSSTGGRKRRVNEKSTRKHLLSQTACPLLFPNLDSIPYYSSPLPVVVART